MSYTKCTENIVLTHQTASCNCLIQNVQSTWLCEGLKSGEKTKTTTGNCQFFLFYSKFIEYMVSYIFLITFVSDFALLYIVLIHLKKEEGIN